MASLHKHKTSPYWYCSYRKPDGSWALRSTKQKGRRQADEVCRLWEKASHEALRGRLTEQAARKVIGEVYALTHDEPLDSATVKEFFEAWLTRKHLETAESTRQKYREVTTRFLAGSIETTDSCRNVTFAFARSR